MSQADLQRIALSSLLPRLACPACGDALAAEDAEAFSPLRCAGCDARFGFRGGVLDLSPPHRPLPPRTRRYPHGGAQLDFYAFFHATLAMGAYQDTDVEDELFGLLAWMDLEPEAPILQVGVGQGELTWLLAESMPDAPILAIDDDLTELAQARRNLLAGGHGLVLPVLCDVNNPPLARGAAFGAALHFGVLHGLPSPEAHLASLGRALRAGGRLVGVTLAASTLPHIAASQVRLAEQAQVRFVEMGPLALVLARAGWASVRHEQPSHWMARFVAVRR